MELNKNVIAFTGGGTGGHIYPGLAVADELREIAKNNSIQDLKIFWIGCSNANSMDKKIVEKAGNTIDKFYGIPSGKLRRYFSWQNFTDLFRIIGGYFSAKHVLRKLKPAVLFSKGGFVSVPPVLAAKHLGIPVYTHECDFTLGLANRLNFKSAKTMFVSYEETKNRLSEADRKRVVVTGNPVRPVFYNADTAKGKEFLGISNNEKPVLLVLGGSSGARQINEMVYSNLEFLTKNFVVVHQTGLLNSSKDEEQKLVEKYSDYKPFEFIYSEMPDVVACADVVLSRAGANSIWETAVLLKPMVLVPLCGSGTRGDQVDNAEFFRQKNAAQVLIGKEANSENLLKCLSEMLSSEVRENYVSELKKMVFEKKPAQMIAEILYDDMINQ